MFNWKNRYESLYAHIVPDKEEIKINRKITIGVFLLPQLKSWKAAFNVMIWIESRLEPTENPALIRLA